PYIFVMSPVLLMINATPFNVLQMMVTSIIGMIGIGAAVSAFLITRAGWLERIIFFAGGLLLIDPGLATDLIGAGLLIVGYLSQRIRLARQKAADKNSG
ncbi:MAG: TRAP transporter permease, partial [Desulfocucumaceae bacterium]